MIYDYLIVGSGISGLNLGIKLSKKYKNANILIVESSDSIGGRIQTVYDKDTSYEAGAARFNKNHKNLIKYIKHYKLDKNIIEIPSSWKYVQVSKKIYKTKFSSVDDLLNFLVKNFSNPSDILKKYLRSKNLYEVCIDIFGKEEADYFVMRHPYYSELHILNAYDAIKEFKSDLNENLQFYVLGGGLSQITKNMHEECKHYGCNFKLRTMFLNSKFDEKEKIFKNTCRNKDYENIVIESKNVILSIDGKSFKKINLSNFDKYMIKSSKKITMKDLQNSLSVQPLLRTYAKYKKNKGDAWFKNLPKISTDDKVKFIIPITDSVIMISYTDGKYAKYWHNKSMNDTQLDTLNKSLHKILPDTKISESPVYLKNYYWDQGASYWKKNINSDLYSKLISKPTKLNLYVCGDSFSHRQAWIEGALETSNNVYNLITK
jgi:hypothetical protein